MGTTTYMGPGQVAVRCPSGTTGSRSENGTLGPNSFQWTNSGLSWSGDDIGRGPSWSRLSTPGSIQGQPQIVFAANPGASEPAANRDIGRSAGAGRSRQSKILRSPGFDLYESEASERPSDHPGRLPRPGPLAVPRAGPQPANICTGSASRRSTGEDYGLRDAGRAPGRAQELTARLAGLTGVSAPILPSRAAPRPPGSTDRAPDLIPRQMWDVMGYESFSVIRNSLYYNAIQTPLSGRVTAAFDGGSITSNAGALLLRAADRALGLVDRVAACFTDHRDARLTEHSVRTLVAQRIMGIALGHEDLNDHDELRHDPLLALLAGRLEAAARTAWRWRARTLNRLEHAPPAGAPDRYHRIEHDADALQAVLLESFIDRGRADGFRDSFWTSTRPTTRSTATRRAGSTRLLPPLLLPAAVHHLWRLPALAARRLSTEPHRPRGSFGRRVVPGQPPLQVDSFLMASSALESRARSLACCQVALL